MLDKLVESKSHHSENKNRNRLFGLMSVFAIFGLVFAFVFSLFSYELSLGSGDLSVSSLRMPLMVEEPQPEPPAPMQKTTQTQTKSKTEVPMRVENIQRVEETPVKLPEKVSVTPSKNQARPNTPFKIGERDTTPVNPSYQSTEGRETGGSGGTPSGIAGNSRRVIEDKDEDLPAIKPTVKESPKETPKKEPEAPKKDIVVSGGVVNGKAVSLSKPSYPSSARAVGAKGKVEVRIMIDENGRVTSASIISGHPLLREPALTAARNSVFQPTLLSGEKVKVSGIIVYNFNAD